MNDALSFEGFIICVLESKPTNEPLNATWIPILVQGPKGMLADPKQLDAVTFAIDRCLKRGEPCLIHCGAGIERSPLAAAKYLEKYHKMTLDNAYNLIIKKRPQVQDRRLWL